MNRRDMIGLVGAGGAGLMMGSANAIQATGNNRSNATGGSASGGGAHSFLSEGYNADANEFVLPPLPYGYGDLDPSIDEQTMRLHHDKHHAGYVKGLNTALNELANARSSGDYNLVQHWSRKVSFNGGGHTLHTLFWTSMAPAKSSGGNSGGGEPGGALKQKIEQDFGSVNAMRDQFSAAAGAVEGSGWGICGIDAMSKKLIIIQGENQQKLTTWGVTPVLVLDVWEHAYYLKYQNRRADYVKAWWDVVNWNEVQRRVELLV